MYKRGWQRWMRDAQDGSSPTVTFYRLELFTCFQHIYSFDLRTIAEAYSAYRWRASTLQAFAQPRPACLPPLTFDSRPGLWQLRRWWASAPLQAGAQRRPRRAERRAAVPRT